MSEFSHCSSGGQNGIRVSDEELNEFSNEIGSKNWKPDMFGKRFKVFARWATDSGYSEKCLKVVS
ncbi:MAG TPA: hypothetical protein PLF27_10930 [Sedimentibacter sp.]|nr:hypothetical protein [Sedimentibacter sp.]